MSVINLIILILITIIAFTLAAVEGRNKQTRSAVVFAFAGLVSLVYAADMVLA